MMQVEDPLTPGLVTHPTAAICCMCGITISPNPTHMCLQCLRTQVNVASAISSRVSMYQCRGCLKYMGGSGGSGWGHFEHESRELMAVCLKKIAGLKTVRLVDAVWIWTEPHSKRLKIKLTVQKEVMNGAVLQESLVVEFVVRNQQCPDCQAFYATGAWKAIVQVRQRVDHKRTFLHLEQLILKHSAHARALQIKSFKDGMDFYYAERNQGVRFSEFLESAVPVTIKHSKKLVGQDDHSNTVDYKYTSVVEIVPVCKDDLVVLPPKLARNLGDMPRLCLVQRVSSSVHLIDPLTGQMAEVTVDKYMRAGNQFRGLLSASRLEEFMVLGWEPALAPTKTSAPTRKTSKHRLAEVEVARMSDLGVNDKRYRVVTHLGHLLKAGDTVEGYGLAKQSMNSPELDELERKTRAGLPEVVLVRKVYTDKKNKAFKLKNLEKDEMETDDKDRAREEKDAEEYRRQLHGDSEMRRAVNLYRARRGKMAVDTDKSTREGSDVDEEDEEELRIDELLDDLELDDADAPPDHVGGSGVSGEAEIVEGRAGVAPPGFQFTFSAKKNEGVAESATQGSKEEEEKQDGAARSSTEAANDGAPASGSEFGADL